MDNAELLLVNLAKARRERFKQVILNIYKKKYLTSSVREREPLPPKNLEFIIQNKMHLEMQYITNIYSIISNFINYVYNSDKIETEILDLINFKNLIEYINKSLGSSNYKYGISGSNAWYNLFKDITPVLSDYELSAISKYNTKEYLFIIRNKSDEELLIFQLNIIKKLKEIRSNLNKYVQLALKELAEDKDQFSYFNGKDVYVGITPYINNQMLFDNCFSFSINLYIANPDTIIPENEIVINNNTFATNSEFDNFMKECERLKNNGNKPTEVYQVASFIGKYKQYEKKYTDDNFEYVLIPKMQQMEVKEEKPKIIRTKRKTLEEQEKEENEKKYAKALNYEMQKEGRLARYKIRTEATNEQMKTGGKKINKKNNKKGGKFTDDVTGFIKIKLFTFSFNYFNKIEPIVTSVQKELKDNETLLFDNFDKLLAIKEDTREEYFGLEGLYILNKIMDNRDYIERNRYNPYKIRNFIFKKFILSEKYSNPIEKVEQIWYIIDIFEKTFKKQNIIKEFVYNNMKIDILEVHPELKKIKEIIETGVIEILRPYINKTIIDINDELNTKIKFDIDKTEDEKLPGIFILGGDALNRYQFNATKTNDIDSKIYIPVKIPYSKNDPLNIESGLKNEKTIFRCITKHLIKLLTYLENNKITLFEILKTSELSHTEILIDREDKIIVDVNFITEDPNMVNFKFRKSGKPNFPVDLYSIDYKCEFKITLREKIMIIPINISFIDIVVKQEGNNYYNRFSVFANNNLPIAKLEFLLSDLLNTYNENDLSLLRFFSGKTDKDYVRLKLLWDLYFKQKSATPIYSIDENNIIHFIDEINKKNNKKINAVIDYTVDEKNKLYSSIMDILESSIDKKRINNIKQFGDYRNPTLDFDVKTGGKGTEFIQNLSVKLLDSKKTNNKYKSIQPSEREIFDVDYRYTQTNITDDLINLSNIENDVIINDTSPFTSFNNEFYSEFALILTPEFILENDNVMLFGSIKLVSDIKKMANNANIFFDKKQISETILSKIIKEND